MPEAEPEPESQGGDEAHPQELSNASMGAGVGDVSDLRASLPAVGGDASTKPAAAAGQGPDEEETF